MALTQVKLAAMSANSVDSDQYVDGSIDNAHLADDAVDSDEIAAGAIDAAHMAANSIDSDQYVDGSIDTVHIADNQVNGDKLTDNIDIAGTLDVTSAAVFDSKATVAGEFVVGDTNPPTYQNIGTDDTFVYLHHEQDGGNCGIQVANKAAAGSDDEAATIHLTPMFGGHGVYFKANREGDYASAANASSSLEVKVNNANTVTTALTVAKTGAATFASTVSDSKGNLRNIPAGTNTTLIQSDAGKHFSITAGITINASTDFAIGDAVTIFNNQAAGNDETITATGIDLYWAADPSVSGATNRTLAPRGVATILCVAADKYVITGAGLT